MAEARITSSINIAGMNISGSAVRTGDGPSAVDPQLPLGKAGELTTRTDANTGVATLSTGHGITSGDVVDVYWEGGMRYGMDATVATDDVTIDGGAGDDLPAEDTVVVVSKQVTVNLAIDGDALHALGIVGKIVNPISTAKGHVSFFDAGDAEIAQFPLRANQPRVYDIDGGHDNPFTGNPIAYLKASGGSANEQMQLIVGVLQDTTPEI